MLSLSKFITRKRYIRYNIEVGSKKFSGWFQNTLLTLRFVTLSSILFAVIFTFKNTPVIKHDSPSSDDLYVVSTNNKNGSTNPGDDNQSAKKIVNYKGTKLSATSKVIPKPNWVSLPLYIDPYNSAANYLPLIIDTPEAKYVSRLSQTPVAQWFGDWNTNVTQDVASYTTDANQSNSIPIVVAYNIPQRDCGGYSVGGSLDPSSYLQWIQKLANGINKNKAVVILEPDALGALDCLPNNIRSERINAIASAVKILKQNPNTFVYIDAGTSAWQPVDVMSQRLNDANIAEADGFSLNVSYFAPTKQSQDFGDKLSKLVGNKHYVIDTSRNGANKNVTGMQCNPSFAAFGQQPTTNINNPLNDALLWIKIPWESDGQCNGNPGPGQNFWAYVSLMAKNANW